MLGFCLFTKKYAAEAFHLTQGFGIMKIRYRVGVSAAKKEVKLW